jgi:valyl-tRNA synthetase
VKEVFVRLFDNGLIYNGKYIVNWCPFHCTALSDDEVEHSDHQGHLWHFRYPIEGLNQFAVVATTRPETMLGDTAVAVHPDDERYKQLIGKFAILPLVNRRIPIIADEYVDPAFGTGMVKVTPAHDPNDFYIGQRHNLEQINIMDEKGNLKEIVPEPYRRKDRFEARKLVVKDLEAQGLVEKIEKYQTSIGKCYRCHTVIEPYLSDQWFVKMKPLAEPALRVVQEGKIRLYPERWQKVYEHWMTNIRDWCISRQIWWGHRIPVYYAQDGRLTAARNENEARQKLQLASNIPLRQDEDVLDTWFSSWLWPFSTLDWPRDNPDLRYFNPTDTLVTAPEIIFFWVARMIMANMEFMKGEPNFNGEPRTADKEIIPFKNVYFTSTVRDLQGRKMSKSLGNSPDPIDVIRDYGADALRFTITYLAPVGQDVLFSTEKCDIGRNFANKIWNAGRFLLMNAAELKATVPDELPTGYLDLADEWILSRFNTTVKNINSALEEFRFNESTRLLYDFVWHDFCDWYVEFAKTRFYGDEPYEVKQTVLKRALALFDNVLRLLHPIMPFLSEELWQNLKERDGGSISNAEFPKTIERWINPTVEKEMDFIQNVINSIRNIRGENTIPPSKEISVAFFAERDERKTVIQKYERYIRKLCKSSAIESFSAEIRPKFAATSVVDGVELLVPLAGLIDVEAERTRLMKEITRLESALQGIEKKLSNENFVSRAPKEVIQKEKEKQASFALNLEKLKKNLKTFG